MNFLAAIWNFLTEPKHRNNYELQQFVKSEFKNDWQWAYQNITLQKKIPYAK